ncbi:MAG: hypothetical protein LBH64_03245 [Coriobacteriales bacterium]|jgi:ABC-2 type transport system permease protein|nr:hypothetical protein [Coriobacteriales bacterium]
MNAIRRFGRLALLILRRDRLWFAAWGLGLLALGTFFAPMMTDIVGDETSRLVLMTTMESPMMLALCGPFYGDSFSYGALYTQFMLVWVALAFAIMNILSIVRHTRKDEEDGRSEMLAALPVGRSASLMAAFVVALGVNVLIALTTGLTIPLFAVEGMELAGSMTFACSVAVCGICFAGLTAVLAQLLSTARGVSGVALALCGALFLLRAIGDMGSSTGAELLACLSPFGLIERGESFVANHLWPVATLLLVALLLWALAFVLNAIRNHGQGILPARSGRAHASRFLRGELGLSWRLSRGMVIAWAVAVVVLAASYGSVLADLGDFVESNSLYQAMLGVGAGSDDAMRPALFAMTAFMSITVAIPVVMVVLRLGAEEERGRMEGLLATPLARARLILYELLIACVLACVFQLLSALSMWAAAEASLGAGAGEAGSTSLGLALYCKTALACLPAVLVFAALGIFLLGIAPRARAIIWVYLAFSFLVALFGNVLSLPTWLSRLSVFDILPRYPAEAFEPMVALALCALCLVLFLIGTAAYRRRDLR